MIPHLRGSAEWEENLAGARRKPEALRFRARQSCRGLIYPGGASAKCQTSVSTRSQPPNSAPLRPDSPPSPPAERGREVPRKRGREILPSPGRSKAYQHWETLPRPIRLGRARGLPKTPRSPRKKYTSLRLALVLPPLHCLETEPGASPRPGKSTWGPEVLPS